MPAYLEESAGLPTEGWVGLCKGAYGWLTVGVEALETVELGEKNKIDYIVQFLNIMRVGFLPP